MIPVVTAQETWLDCFLRLWFGTFPQLIATPSRTHTWSHLTAGTPEQNEICLLSASHHVRSDCFGWNYFCGSCFFFQILWKLPNRNVCSLQEQLLAVGGPCPPMGVWQLGARRLVRLRRGGEGWRWRRGFGHVQRSDGRNPTSADGEEQRPEQKRDPDRWVLPRAQSHSESRRNRETRTKNPHMWKWAVSQQDNLIQRSLTFYSIVFGTTEM